MHSLRTDGEGYRRSNWLVKVHVENGHYNNEFEQLYGHAASF